MFTCDRRARATRLGLSVAMLLVLAILVSAITITAQQAAPGGSPPSRKPARAAGKGPQGPNLGVPATPAQIEVADVSVGPDGAGLPPGSGTSSQGEAIFNTKCIMCHGSQGVGGVNDQLAGGNGTLATRMPVKTIGSYWPYATTVFDYVRRAMPYPAPHSLTDAEVYALTAYLLSLNGVIAKDAVMDATTLPRVQMPNRGNFVIAYPDRKQ